MHDQPEPTEEDQEQTPERLEEEEAQRGTGQEQGEEDPGE